jgi:hypothetical protein
VIEQIKGTRRWPYQFKSDCGGRIKVSGPQAFEVAEKIAALHGFQVIPNEGDRKRLARP